MSQKLDKQKENVNSLLKLIAENPELRIVPMVDSEVVCDDGHNWWQGSWGKSEIDEIYIGDEQIYFKSLDCEDLEQDYIDEICFDDKYKNLPDEEFGKKAAKHVNRLPWEKVIVVRINLPEEAADE